MTFKIKTLLIGACALGLSACGDTNYATSWNQEAGAFLDEGGFGNPTMRNMMAQMCRGQAKGHIVPDPVVMLHPSSTKAAPVYVRGHVRCSGHLNGKYAQVIFREYVRSAVPPITVEGGQLGTTGESGG